MDESMWMTVTHEDLVLRRRAYWLSLQHYREKVGSQETIMVRIPERNLLDIEELCDLMERSSKGDI